MKTSLTILITLLFFTSIFPQTPGTVIWEFQASGEINSSPAIDDNGIIYFGSSDSSMYAVYPDGTQKWKYRTEGEIYSSPAIGNDGTIYFGSYDSCFYAINPDGTLNWKYETKGKVKSSPAISEDGTIYFGSYDSCFYAINNDGTLKWKYKTGGIIEPSPAIGNDGSIYIGSDDNVFYSFSKDGIVNWKLQTNYSGHGKSGFASASLGYNGTIYISNYSEDKLYTLNKDGSIKFVVNKINSNPFTLIDLYENFYSPIVTSDTYFNNSASLNKSGGPYYYLLAHNNKSELKWIHEFSVNSNPIIADEETILRGDFKYLHSIDIENNLKWLSNYFPIDNYYYYTLGRIALYKNGTLYYSIEEKLFALTTDNKGLSKSSWPCFRQNSKNTGSIENYPYAFVAENHITLDSSGTISLDATPSYDPNGEQLTYLWKIKKQTEGSSVILTDSASAKIQVNIPKNRGEYVFLLEVKNEKGKTATSVIKVNNLIKWEFSTNSRIESSPAIDKDGTIYIGSSNNNFYAISPDGTKKWEFQTGHYIKSSPAIGKDGTIYIGSYDNNLYAINPDGTKRWEFPSGNGIESSPAIGNDGTIYIGSDDNNLYAINPDGTKKWKFKTNGTIYSSPAIGNDGTIYFGALDNLYALNPDGTKKWDLYIGSWIGSSPAIGKDGTIYFGALDKLYALNPNRTKKWNFYIGSWIESSPVIGKDGTIYIGSDDNNLYAINPDGTKKWEYKTEGWIKSSPTIGNDGTIYIGSYDNNLYALNPEGTKKWGYKLYGSISSSLTINSNGTLYIGTAGNQNKLYAINTDSKGLADSPWPKFRKDIYNNANSEYILNPKARVIKNYFSMTFGKIILDASPSSSYNGSSLSYLWRVVKKTNKIELNIKDSTSVICEIEIPKIHGEYIISLQVTDSEGIKSLTSVNIANEVLWKFKTGDYIKSSPAIGNDGTIYIGSNDNNLYAINPDGTKKWDFNTGNNISSSPAIGNDGTIYIGSNNSNLSAINPDGTKKWEFNTGSIMESSPAIGKDGTIYIGSYDNNLYAINPDGTKKWEFSTGAFIESSPAISNDGTIYVGSWDNNLYAINPDGTKKWEYQTGNDISFSPAVGKDGTIYIGSKDQNLYAINPKGIKKWETKIGYGISSSPAIGKDGIIYVGSSDKNLYAINTNGLIKWKFPTSSGISSSPAIGDDGTIYIGSDDYYFYAIFSESTGLADSPWPKSGGNNFNSGISHYIVPGFSADTLSGKFPLTVHFSDTSFGNVFNRHWDFGDGQTSTEKNPVHTYAYPDSFTVTLIISNPSKTDTLTKENYIVALNATGIADNSELPKEFKLYENYPNPFNPQTNIEFDVKEKTTVKLRVYNVVGQLVTTLTDNMLEAGHYKYQFNGNNLASGIYFYKIEMGKYVSIKKMMLLK